MRSSWEALAIGEGSVTATLAGVAAVYFLRRHQREQRPGRRTASMALALSTAGAAAVAAHGVTLALGGGQSAGASLVVGLPALAGQALLVLLVLRRWR